MFKGARSEAGGNAATAFMVEPVEHFATLTVTQAQIQAEQHRIGAAIFRQLAGRVGVPDPTELRSAACELAAATNTSQGHAQRIIEHGFTLTEFFPEVFAYFEIGEITLLHANHIADAGQTLLEQLREARSPEAILQARELLARFEAEAVEFARSATPARTKARAQLLAASLAPQTMVEKHQRAREERCLQVFDRDDGMSTVSLLVPTPIAHGISSRVRAIARGLRELEAARVADERTAARTAGDDPSEVEIDERTADQLGADIAADLLLAGNTDTLLGSGLEAVRGTVNVTINATTLAGTDNTPAELDGVGPIAPDVARVAAKFARVWNRLFIGRHGELLATDAYQPTMQMRRHIQARDQHCRFPGCRSQAATCEIDHTQEFSRGGKTTLENLACLCPAHHALKHPDLPDRTRWNATQTSPGIIEWRDPRGRVYIDEPTPRVAFVEVKTPQKSFEELYPTNWDEIIDLNNVPF